MRYWPQPDPIRIQVAAPSLSPLEAANLAEAVHLNEVGPHGAFVGSFEQQFGELVGAGALSVANGSVALMLALRALGVGPGDQVLVPSLTYAACVSSVMNVGATPLLCDVDSETWGISVESMTRMITANTKAVIAVHLYGTPCNVLGVQEFCRQHGLYLIEDCAESLLASTNDQHVGQFGDVATFSFFANKLVSCGEGGAVTSSNPELIAKMRLLRGQGMSPVNRYIFDEPGYNFRLSNLQAAVLCAQLTRLDELASIRQDVEEMYALRLGADYVRPYVSDSDRRAPWLSTGLLPAAPRDIALEVAQSLASRGIETRPVFPVLTDSPAFSGCECDVVDVARGIAFRGISLPTHEGVDSSVVEEIVSVIKSHLE